MKIFILLSLLLLSSLEAIAAYNEKLIIKQVADDGVQFVFLRKEGPAPWKGIMIKDPDTKAILYEVQVKKCSATTCLGEITKNNSGIKIRMDEEYVHSYNEISSEAQVKEIPPVPKPKKVIEPPPPKKDPKDMRQSAYLGYGSPIGPGFKLGYNRLYERYTVGINYSNISSTTENVNLKGHLLSGFGAYNAFKFDNGLDLNVVGELGLAKAALDFTAVEPTDGPSIDETTYFVAFGGEAKLNFERFSVSAKSGMSKAGMSDTYDGRYFKYANPYGTILVFLEIGAYYRF